MGLNLRPGGRAKGQHGAAAQGVRQELLKAGGEIERPGKRDDRLSTFEPAADASGGVFGG